MSLDRAHVDGFVPHEPGSSRPRVMTALGDQLPDFELPDVYGRSHSLPSARPAVVVFTANLCPHARAWHPAIVDVAKEYAARGLAVFAVNSNDPRLIPEDAPDSMRRRHETEDWGPVPYLVDADQELARRFGAESTPDVFLLDADRTLVFRSPPDDDYENPSVPGGWLRDAVEAVLDGRRPPERPSTSVGCPIKWSDRPAHPPWALPGPSQEEDVHG